MDSDHQRLQRIEDYLAGLLSPEDTLLFEEKMEQGAELEREVREYMKGRLIGYGQSKESLKKELDKLFEVEETPIKKTGKFNQRIVFIAAALVGLILIIIGINWLNAPHRNPEKWAMSYATPINVPEIRSQAVVNLMDEAGVAFNKKDYSQAIKLYRQALAVDSLRNDLDIHFYLGQAYLFTGQPDPAISQLKMAANYPEEAEWYMALASLYQGYLVASRSSFEKMADIENHAFQSEAQQILKDFP